MTPLRSPSSHTNHPVSESPQLALGTAQLTGTYGLRARGIQPETAAVADLLAHARGLGVRTLDTATAYGDAEALLGTIGVRDWDVITKVPAVPPGENPNEWITSVCRASLDRLRIDILDTVLLHHPEQVLSDRGAAIYAGLEACRDAGMTRRIGISVYSPAEAEQLCERFEFDVVQLPTNLLDQRLRRAPSAQALTGTALHVRSLFLQGLLLMAPDEADQAVPSSQAYVARVVDWCGEMRISPLEASIRFAAGIPGVERLVVGVDRPEQLDPIVTAIAEGPLQVPAALACDDLQVIDPRSWAT